MKTDKTTVYDLFQTKRRYIVPIFQRGYVWTLEKQWKPLWEDIVAQAGEVAHHRSTPGRTLHKHFLGAVVLNLVHTSLKEVPVFEIIDGQQRLTTLQVLLAAVRDETKHLDNAYVRADLETLTANRGPFVDDNERFKIWPTSAMQEHVATVLEAGSWDALRAAYGPPKHVFKYNRWQPPRPALAEAYLFFAEAVRNYLDDDPDELPYDLVELPVAERLDVLVDALLRHIQLVTIELEQEDDAQVIFESLNARGEPLTPSDLVRNFVFLTATRDGANVADLYQKHWRPFEEVPMDRPFWKQIERQGRLRRTRLDLFLFHYATFRTAEEIQEGRLYQAFREWWESEPRAVGLELEALSRYAAIYQKLLAPDTSSRFGQFAHRLRILDTTVVYPLLLWAAGELGEDSQELHGIMEDIESWLVRRAVCNYGAKSYSRLFLEWFAKLRESGAAPSRNAVRAMLTSSQAASAVWPTDEEFRRNLVHEPLYSSPRARRAQMVLAAINQRLRPKHAEEIEIKSPLTVEHVLPQGAYPGHWPLEVSEEETRDEAFVRRNRLTHALGNLTLLTQPLNSSVSNGPYSAKRPEISKQSLLPINAYFQTQPTWDEADILARGAELAAVALEIWPGPGPVS